MTEPILHAASPGMSKAPKATQAHAGKGKARGSSGSSAAGAPASAARPVGFESSEFDRLPWRRVEVDMSGKHLTEEGFFSLEELPGTWMPVFAHR